MNYLRGAVSAISAPYQYYRDLNPSTLTGAIDVIVIRRPKQTQDGQDIHDESGVVASGETELVCSPFHVRFGKWQVLRPADKKVDVFVNGKPVPFSMKIGDAGEAFFIFETDEDVPDDLVTSPLLAATNPGESNAHDEPTGRFGAKASPDHTPSEDMSQEPDFLDLNAPVNGEARASTVDGSSTISLEVPNSKENDAQKDAGNEQEGPSFIERTAAVGKGVAGMASELIKSETDNLKDKTLKEAVGELKDEESTYIKDRLAAAQRSASGYMPFGGEKGDEALPATEPVDAPEVRYTHDAVLDMEGYHAQRHTRDRSEKTVMGDDTPGPSTPRSRSRTPSARQTPEASRSPSPEPSSYTSPVPFPIRATSEPPPDTSELHSSDLQLPSNRALKPSLNDPTASSSTLRLSIPPETDEYSWEWGSFPQRTPTIGSFAEAPAALNGKGKNRMSHFEEGPDDFSYWTSLAKSQKSRLSQRINAEELEYGAGGRLTVDRRDPTRFRVFIEGRTAEFELSLISGGFKRVDEMEDARRFDEGKIEFTQFLNNEQLLRDENLVIRWARDMYITQRDDSPLVGALAVWRESALSAKSGLFSSRPGSPAASDRTRADSMDSSGAPTPDERDPKGNSGELTAKKPSSTSWVRWWGKGRRNVDPARPELRPVSSEPGNPKATTAEDALPPVPRVPLADAHERRSRSVDTVQLHDSKPEERKPKKRFAKTLRLTSEQLKSLDLKSGANTITFSLSSTGVVACTARLFVWDHTDLVVVSDIDGTITKSDALGHVFTMIGRDWTHLGVAKLYTDICRNGYKIMYLTSRAIGQADSTRDYLKGIKQNEYQLPEGPVIMSPDRLMASLHREVIMRKPEVFKMACLRDIQRLFGSSARNPFYAGFGNRITDALSYRSVNVPSSRIFTIDSTGEVKMELLELAGYKSSYIHMTDLVDQMFPPIHRKWAAEYTDFNYWKAPVQEFALPDLSPPSPALSARSDTSNQSTLARLRNFSLVGNRSSNNISNFSLPPVDLEAGRGVNGQSRKDQHLRQMSSLERLSSTLASFTSSAAASPRSESPTFFESGTDSGDEEESEMEKGKRGGRRRTRSMSSMPGSLPGSPSPGSDDEMEFGENDEEGEGEGDEYEYQEEAAEAFDEDLLATGEMENIPFL
ncbi:LNS2-domain-containing protein [Cristinia sonorae]|uniref:phosphatidate phosphatase n=1 Tax=Cristinia sonorae TaxID=1940300 RepID=A0A8K0XN87_9AGAR|nr:LNS2-domain-containing protein [Cristinia sonorae]